MSTSAIDRPASIQQIVDGIELYNPENKSHLETLEGYLAEQCQKGHNDLHANLAILKIYQFNPALAKESNIVHILAKALTATPATDFNLCLYLLRDLNNTSVQQLTELHRLLEQSRYKAFWDFYQKHTDLTKAVAGLEDAIRASIAHVVSMSYQSINATVLRSFLSLPETEFTTFCQSKQWQEKDGIVTIPVNKDNEAKAVVVREHIKLEQLSKVIGCSDAI